MKIGVVSGKGGVGKSLVTSMLSIEMRKRGNNVAILDADITGPSIPKAFGITERAYAIEQLIIPAKSQLGINIMSLNLLVLWEDIDYMFVDILLEQEMYIACISVTSFSRNCYCNIPTGSGYNDCRKSIKMAGAMNIPVLGIVENMSYFECTDCGKRN